MRRVLPAASICMIFLGCFLTAPRHGERGREPTTEEDLTRLVGQLEIQVAGQDLGKIFNTASRIGEAQNHRLIPVLIGLIDSDNSYKTVYGIGYFALGRLTGVRYDQAHHGPWWRKWWEAYKRNFPEEVHALPIPDYPKTPHGEKFASDPPPSDSIILEPTLKDNMARIEIAVKKKHRGRIYNLSGRIAEFRDLSVIPKLIELIESDNTYDTVYGIGYFALGRLTGVKYDKSHDGPWWTKWWALNRDLPMDSSRKKRWPAVPRQSVKPEDRYLKARLEEQWGIARRALESGNFFADKKDFTVAYWKWRQIVDPDPETLRGMEDTLKPWITSHGKEPGFPWRAQSLLSEMAEDRGELELAVKRLDRAMELYPDRAYAQPRKQSKFHHLVTERAMLIWDSEGVDAAVEYVADLLAREPRYRFFYLPPWSERFVAEQQPKGVLQLVSRLQRAVAERSRRFPAHAEECAGLSQEFGTILDEVKVEDRDLTAGGDPRKRYFLIGPKAGAKALDRGFGLLLILPGGGGGADFHPFVKRIYMHGLGEDWLAAQPIAVKWNPGQRIVWPIRNNPVLGMKFSTEEFVEAVVADVQSRFKIDPRRVFTLTWSSSGPAAYAISLQEKKSVTGSFVAMSVFKPDTLPPLQKAKGHAYFIYHSPEDRSCPFRMAEEAREALKDNGAVVGFHTYKGGHGWHGEVFEDIRKGIHWLENVVARKK